MITEAQITELERKLVEAEKETEALRTERDQKLTEIESRIERLDLNLDETNRAWVKELHRAYHAEKLVVDLQLRLASFQIDETINRRGYEAQRDEAQKERNYWQMRATELAMALERLNGYSDPCWCVDRPGSGDHDDNCKFARAALASLPSNFEELWMARERLVTAIVAEGHSPSTNSGCEVCLALAAIEKTKAKVK